jgi:DNA-binding NarL/FixJ family response regulator
MINTIIIENKQNELAKIESLLSAENEIKILGSGTDGYDALKLTECTKPDIVVLENQLEYLEGGEISPLLRARSPSTAIVILLERINDLQLYRTVSNDVSGFVDKETDLRKLPMILKCVSKGGCFISPVLAARLLRIFSETNRGSNVFPANAEKWALSNNSTEINSSLNSFMGRDPAGFLSKMELRILKHKGEGRTNAEIAENLNLAAGTVRNYISAIMRKTGIKNSPALVSYALHCGLVPR